MEVRFIKMEDIFNQIAKRHGVTAAEVKRDIEAAIEAAWESDNPKVRAFQKEIPAAGKKPTPEEMIQFLTERIIRDLEED